jgi:tyrosine-specific transport protein
MEIWCNYKEIMMSKQIGATMLVASTCIGGGMIALPMVLAKIGLIPSFVLMLTIWATIYYTSIINLELHLQAGKGFTLAELGRKFSGRIAEATGLGSLKLLSYALVSVYIYGGSSVIQKMFGFNDIIIVSAIYSFVMLALLSLPIKFIDYVNRLLFLGLLSVVAILIVGLISAVNWSSLPLFADDYRNMSAWTIIIPVAFTSFGFQGSLPSFIKYCNNDKALLKKVFLWGSCIPTIVYMIWTVGILGVLSKDSPEFYQNMLAGEIEVGDLIQELSNIAKWQSVQILIWWISLLAIVTSLLGVGISLRDVLKTVIPKKIEGNNTRNIVSAFLAVVPSYFIAMLVPNAFISVLGFAGIILVVIAIFLPIYLLSKIKDRPYKCIELNSSLIGLSAIAGCIVVISKLLTLYC